eukprot:3605949-Amphidinium_carterae.3
MPPDALSRVVQAAHSAMLQRVLPLRANGPYRWLPLGPGTMPVRGRGGLSDVQNASVVFSHSKGGGSSSAPKLQGLVNVPINHGVVPRLGIKGLPPMIYRVVMLRRSACDTLEEGLLRLCLTRVTALRLYKVMQSMGAVPASSARKCNLVGPTQGKAKKSEQEIRDGYAYINSCGPTVPPTGSTGNENLIWAEVEQATEDSPIFGWDLGRIEKECSDTEDCPEDLGQGGFQLAIDTAFLQELGDQGPGR